MNHTIRAKNFLGAFKMVLLNDQKKDEYINICKSILKQFEIHQDAKPTDYYGRMKIIERLFQFLMEHPEFIAHHANFRNVSINKAKEMYNDLIKLNVGRCELMSDYLVFCEMIKERSDYKTLKEYNIYRSSKPTHRYNLRPRKPRSFKYM